LRELGVGIVLARGNKGRGLGWKIFFETIITNAGRGLEGGKARVYVCDTRRDWKGKTMTKTQAMKLAKTSSAKYHDYGFACLWRDGSWKVCNWAAGLENVAFYKGKLIAG
jgi:hypothetical protein